ncbi:MAG: zinc-ribbon domain-containing protein, partial [Gemmobacter sp.]
MRIICPNCDAQYEVEDRMIPETGRDVQCSNCGHGWYQYPPGFEPEDEAEEDLPPPAVPGDTPPAMVRPPLDDSLRAILREEAEREASARAAEVRARGRAAASVAVQPDLGLARPAPVPTRHPETAAEPRDPPQASPRTLLPDVERINSTLTADAPPAAGLDARRGGGFLQGFAAVFLVVAVL